MRTNMLREGIKVMAKLGRGIYCIVTKVDDNSGSPIAHANEINADDEIIEDVREFVIDKDNCLAFRFIKDPNPDDKPELEVKDGRLVYEDGHAIEMGSLHAHSLIGSVRGAVIFSVDREDGNIDIYSYMPRRDRFIRLIKGIQPQPVIVKEDDDNIYITEFRSHTEEVDNPDDKDMHEVKEMIDQAFFARLSAKEARKTDMGKERLTELDKQFASMTKEQAKGIAMAISDMMKKPTDKKPRVKNESNDSKQTEKNS